VGNVHTFLSLCNIVAVLTLHKEYTSYFIEV